MKLAVPVWQNRISPVFDVAGQLLLVELADGRETSRETVLIGDAPAENRADRLHELGVGILICAGVSQSLAASIDDQGIQVIAQVCGDVEEVLAAYLVGRLNDARFAMPGCCGRQRWRRQRGHGCRRGRCGPA